ncbi:MAG: coproporphyrinogen dehydrogenase HemZ [Clostridiales bacterium]|jgi:oxygen-independent coproporphyrinogen-3 oxidase|nr:coproporphyrinogen dehydrogenase HemZ [Clostridiales bacterium]
MILVGCEEFSNDLLELVRAFGEGDTDGNIVIGYGIENGVITAQATLLGTEHTARENLSPDGDALERKRRVKSMLKRLLYELLKDVTGRRLPYGSLTGVRPTKLAYELTERYKKEAAAVFAEKKILNDPKSTAESASFSDEKKGIEARVFHTLTDYYSATPAKANLVLEILKNQEGLYKSAPDLYDVYIHIPFCPTRCAYCSFVSTDMTKTKKMIEPYAERLLQEIDLIYTLSGGECNALYIGGGTPTALDEKTLMRILEKAAKFKKNEFTVEAGRPDTIDENKLRLIKEYGVNRISINPQSVHEKTLNAIGRKHTAMQFYTAFESAKKYGFSINADVIAMLPDESLSDFLTTVKICADLAPDNITVHNLALKRGSCLTLSDYRSSGASDANRMTDGAYALLKAYGYAPYYMSRQKYMSGNLENCGYTKPNAACLYNVDIMEETHSILAAGAGAISKRVAGDRIDRQANINDVKM